MTLVTGMTVTFGRVEAMGSEVVGSICTPLVGGARESCIKETMGESGINKDLGDSMQGFLEQLFGDDSTERELGVDGVEAGEDRGRFNAI